MTAPVPCHLAGHAVDVGTHVPHARRFALRSSAGGELFSVHFAGELWDAYNLIVSSADTLALVVAVAEDTGERVTVFDASVHGRSAPGGGADREASERYTSPQGTDVFRIEVEVIDDEDTTGPDDFTALSIGGVDEDGDRFWFVEEDLT